MASFLKTGPGTVCFAAGPRSSWASSWSTCRQGQEESRDGRAPRGARSCAGQAAPCRVRVREVLLEKSGREPGGAVGITALLSDLHCREVPPAVVWRLCCRRPYFVSHWVTLLGPRALEPTLHTVSGQLRQHLY